MVDERHPVPMDERLRNSKDKQVSIRWPLAVDQRLDALCRRADDEGERTNRRELLAALIAAASYSGEDLREILRRYRTARVGEVVLDVESEEEVIQLATYRPGPRGARR